MDSAAALRVIGARRRHCVCHRRASHSSPERLAPCCSDLDDQHRIIEKGRLIEIEALYVSLCGLAIIFWLSFFLQKKSPWLIWVPASVFLGLGLLAKGPTFLLFFYGVVLALVGYTKNWRI